MGLNPKAQYNRIQPKWVTQRNHHLHVDHGCFSYLLTPINWWSSQKEKTIHTRHTTNNKRVS